MTDRSPSKPMNGQATSWHASESYFIYWRSKRSDFWIGNLSDWDAILAGSCIRFGHTSSSGIFSAKYWLTWDGSK